MTISDNASPATQTVSLSGTAVAPAVTLTPSTGTLSFGNVPVNSSQASTVMVANSGTGSLVFGSITLTPGTDFSITSNNCPSTLAVGSNCAIQITFTPTALGTRPAATLSLVDNAAGSPQTVAVNGVGGTALIPTISVNTATLPFGNQGANTTSAPQSVIVSSVGTANLALTSITATAPFIATPSCPSSVAPSNNCTVSVVFAPTSTTPGPVTEPSPLSPTIHPTLPR